MKGVYIVLDNMEGSPGVKAKVEAQIRAFEAAGIGCVLVNPSPRGGRFGPLIRRLPGVDGAGDWVSSVEALDPDFLYIRKPILSGVLLRQLQRLRERNPRLLVLMEFATYPYDGELLSSPKGLALYLKDRHARRSLSQVVDLVCTYSPDGEIFGTPALSLRNGIDIEQISLKSPHEIQTNPVVLCAVAKLSVHHGYDLAISGLANYYSDGGKRDVILHIVGEGLEAQALRETAQRKDVADRVIFHGKLVGFNLDRIYDSSDIALGGFGYHRIGLQKSSSLKSREYLAKGLPIVSAPLDLFAGTSFPYFLEVDPVERPLNMREVIEFRDSVYRDQKDSAAVSAAIRDLAARECDMKTVMQPVVSYVLDGSRAAAG